MKSIRALPRLFIPGMEMGSPFEIPRPEFEKLHNVLRLRSGAEIGVMPNDGSFWVCKLDGRTAVPIEKHEPPTEPELRITILQGLPKGDKVDDIIRSCTEIGVAAFVLFPADRSVVRWEAKKLDDKMRRVQAVAREAAETSFRMRIPTVEYVQNLDEALAKRTDIVALSELESVSTPLLAAESTISLVVGPEGGWAPREVEKLSPYACTLGPRVLRTEHAGFAAASRLLIS
ncbi:MAG: 16S rRNA (uracil(1498)-N(3))-methyltransferase [Armatimonadetes bacterium]|nr:16S rRNA (uracil(1498)-N(3))-methyltransferase [Armatimonadota bacterium]